MAHGGGAQWPNKDSILLSDSPDTIPGGVPVMQAADAAVAARPSIAAMTPSAAVDVVKNEAPCSRSVAYFVLQIAGLNGDTVDSATMGRAISWARARGGDVRVEDSYTLRDKPVQIPDAPRYFLHRMQMPAGPDDLHGQWHLRRRCL